jgi:hypothetical protein
MEIALRRHTANQDAASEVIGRAAGAAPHAPRHLARIAGVLYLLVGIFGGFAQGFVYPRIYVADDAATTSGNILANADLVRLGVVADLFQATVFVFLALTLHRLLAHVHRRAAGTMVVLVALAAGITSLNAIFEFAALRVATEGAYLAAFGAEGAQALVLLLVDIHHYGLLTAQIFFGLWLVPLGYLASTSGWFPRALGVVLVAGGVCYLVDLLAAFLVPGFGQAIHAFIVIPCAIAEIWTVGYLLVRGVRSSPPSVPAPVLA